jgi:hypothetical protein
MTRRAIAAAIGIALGGVSLSAQAALSTGTILHISPGSFFTVRVAATSLLTVNISGFQGIEIGRLQPASGSHAGKPNGSETPAVDNPWAFFGHTGMHQVSGTPVTETSPGSLKMAGWNMIWRGDAGMPLGGDPVRFPKEDDGLAEIRCSPQPDQPGSRLCNGGDSFTLDHTAHVPADHPSGLGGVAYALHLRGTIAGAASQTPGDTGSVSNHAPYVAESTTDDAAHHPKRAPRILLLATGGALIGFGFLYGLVLWMRRNKNRRMPMKMD